MKKSKLEVAKIRGLILGIQDACQEAINGLDFVSMESSYNELIPIYNYLDEIKNIVDSCTEVTEED